MKRQAVAIPSAERGLEGELLGNGTLGRRTD